LVEEFDDLVEPSPRAALKRAANALEIQDIPLGRTLASGLR